MSAGEPPEVRPVEADLAGDLVVSADPPGPVLFHEGAEARLYRGQWLGRPALFKVRVRKAYRHPGLDGRLRALRNRAEARLLVAAVQAGVRVPTLLQVLPDQHVLVEEWVEGGPWKEVLHEATPSEELTGTAGMVARQVALAHENGLVHGDLTSSNIMLGPGGPVLVDWGLGGQGATIEQFGSDLQVLWECIGASHPEVAPMVLEAFQECYTASWDQGEAVLKRREAIAQRGRYR